MSTKYCPNCSHANLPVRGIIAKSCEKCGTSFAKASFSVSISDMVTKPAASQAHFDPNKFLTEKQRKIQAQRAAQRGEEVEDTEYEGDGEEANFDADAFKINVDVPQANTIKLGSLVEQKKGRRDDMYAREKGNVSAQDIARMRKNVAKSGRENPTDIGGE